MKKHLLFFSIILLKYIIGIYAENAEYIIAIRRKKTDKSYIHENQKNQNEIDELVNDRMNDIYDIIENNKNSYVLVNGEMDKNLKELDNAIPLKKRSNKNTKFFFINNSNPKKNNYYKKRSLEITKLNNSTVEYIPFESNLVSHVCPVSNFYIINAYLSEKIVKSVCNLKNVIHCEKSTHLKPIHDIKIEIGEENKYKKRNENELELEESLPIYYDINEIKNETNWSDVNVQYSPLFSRQLSLLSQSPSSTTNKYYDTNFYYPNSAGQGIDIYLVDDGLIVDHDDFDTSERTISCDAVASGKSIRYTSEEEKMNCSVDGTYPDHGIMVTSMAGGNIYGVSKKANLHMIATDLFSDSILRVFHYILEHGTPHKTIISMSINSYDSYSEILDEKLTELINEGFIIFVAAGNDDKDCCANKDSHEFMNFSGYNQTIVVGAINNNYYSDDQYFKASYSNYGKCVDIFAPGTVLYPLISSNADRNIVAGSGTSCSTPLVAGVAASIMSEHPEIEFDNELMRKTLIDLSIKDSIDNRESSDTPSRFINNGKHSVYSLSDINIHCGIGSDGNPIMCQEGCCSRDGKCHLFENYPWDECFIENGCQSELGYCTSVKETIEECDEILDYYGSNFFDPSSDMSNEEIAKNCGLFEIVPSINTMKRIITNQSICSIAKNYKSYPLIENYKREDYLKTKEFCDNNFMKNKKECEKEFENYFNCFINENFDLNDMEIFKYYVEACESITSEKCSVLYNEGKKGFIKNLPKCYDLMENYNYYPFIDEENLDSYYNNMDNFLNFCNTYEQESVKKCNEVLEENIECHTSEIEKGNTDNCEIFNSPKCQKFYKNLLNNSKFVCKVGSIYGSIDLYDNFDFYIYNQYKEKCANNDN